MKQIGSCAACLSAWLLFADRTHAQEVVEPEADGDVIAATDEAAEIDAIIVTGTHIKRIQVEGPLPISVIERDELMASGQANLADAVRDLPYNSFGSVADAPLADTPNLSLPSLRGLGSKYTLTLLDGHRLPNLALDDNGGASASVSGIPLAAIDRIEVLRDGASAIYGSDAIGGVINLLTRRDDTEPQLEFQVEYPEQDGGETHRASIVYGRTHDRGHWLLAAEAQDREILLGADRDYLLELAGTNPNGNPGTFRRFDPVTEDWVGPFQPDPRCPAALDTDPVFPSSVRNRAGTRCLYRLRDLNTERAGFKGRSLFGTMRHEFSESVSGFARIMVVDTDSEGQSAPTPTNGLIIAADNPNNPTRGELGPELGYPLFLLYRLTSLGPRRTAIDEQSLHSLVGLEGSLDWAEGGDWSLALSHNRYDHEAVGTGFALADAVQNAVDSGRFNPFAAVPNDPTGLEDALHQPWRKSETRATAMELAINFDAGFWFDLAASFAFGADVREDNYAIEADPVALAGGVLGIGGYAPPEGAERVHGGIYGEMFLPVAERWELVLATRYDHYEGAGGAFSPKLALAFRPSEAWLLRAAIGRGFQAPDLASAYGGSSSEPIQVVDQVECFLNPTDGCELVAATGVLVPNDQLEPEYSVQGNIGVIWQPHADLEIALDYYEIHLTDRIGRLNPDNILFLELDCLQTGRTCDPILDGQVIRDRFGNIESLIAPAINIANADTRGLDLEIGARSETQYGNFRLDLRVSKVLDFEIDRSPFLDDFDIVGASYAPPWRGTLRLDWQYGNHGLSAGVEYIADKGNCGIAQFADGSPNPECEERIGSHTEIDAQWRWAAPWDGEIAIGGRNLTNRPPPHDFFGNYQYGLYDPNGRVWYLRYRQGF